VLLSSRDSVAHFDGHPHASSCAFWPTAKLEASVCTLTSECGDCKMKTSFVVTQSGHV
jgi:hypothetical protein